VRALLCNRDGKLVASGTYVTKPYAPRGRASARPRGVGVSRLDLVRPTANSDGSATAALKLARKARNIARIKLTIPAGTTMPSSVRAYVIYDVYPLLVRILR
jgi:hypothetical protein